MRVQIKLVDSLVTRDILAGVNARINAKIAFILVFSHMRILPRVNSWASDGVA